MQDSTTILATIHPDGSAVLELDGHAETIATTLREDARREIVAQAGGVAAQRQTPVAVTVLEPDGTVRLVIAPDGAVTVAEETPAPPPAPAAPAPAPSPVQSAADPAPVPPAADPAPVQAADPAPVQAAADSAPVPAAANSAAAQPWPLDAPAGAPWAEPAAPATSPTLTGTPDDPLQSLLSSHETAAAAPPAPSSQTVSSELFGPDAAAAASGTGTRPRQSFLKHEHVEQPATRGWRGFLARTGMRIAPSARERAERADLHAVSQHWAGPRTIAVVNGKGGAGKTPTAINLAAVFARHGGAGVLTWDNNQTRGTLGWRTEQGPHEATLLELLPQTGRLLGTSAQSADLAYFVHHQTADKYDVLRSKPAVLASEQRITAADVSSIHAVAAKYYRLIIIDSGNDETDPLWLQMIDHTDQLVVATSTRDDHAEAGALLLEGLMDRDEHSARLAENAVTIVTQADPKATDSDIRHVADGFRSIAREVATIPFDPTLVDGIIMYDALRPDTRRAWLAAAAAIARGL